MPTKGTKTGDLTQLCGALVAPSGKSLANAEWPAERAGALGFGCFYSWFRVRALGVGRWSLDFAVRVYLDSVARRFRALTQALPEKVCLKTDGVGVRVENAGSGR